MKFILKFLQLLLLQSLVQAVVILFVVYGKIKISFEEFSLHFWKQLVSFYLSAFVSIIVSKEIATNVKVAFYHISSTVNDIWNS